ncbi:SulP family inorganic anion transporter [Paraburkholderia sp. 22099]|jgi:high affinity sulfate transporter 1|uniref:SulP family inorganic anion transporter n=1 Tax=Paraburkholderia TaxID=1822464 RepID=UPI0009F50695|nr:SulP family inorganic anion transporter [Paraburkholderia terricola]MDR6445189.1 high affinity sulfate transporter 1 [Paraburkholderia terricola]ORC51788.1 sodium-independent anion transporter [Burkholderia sp. A27]
MKPDTGGPERPSSRTGRIVSRWVNGLAVARGYRLAWLPHDAIAGLSLSAVLVPAGMAYAEAAGLPVVSGLYASLAALLAYALFGPSRILVLGPDSALVALIAASVAPLAHGNTEHAIALAGGLALLSGAICLAVGMLKLGFVTELLSLPIRYGYLNGIMLTIVVGQIPKLLGFQVQGASFLAQVRELASGVAAGKINGMALTIGVAALAVILGCKRYWPKVPGVLVAVGGATLAVAALGLAPRFGLAVIGNMPQGLPALHLPALALDEWTTLAGGAAAIAFVSFTDISILSRTYEARSGEAVDRNQEFVALGLANIAAGVAHGFAVSASGSRTPVAEAAGAKTQATGVVAALVVAGLLLFAPQALRDTPQAALAAVVIAACLGLLEVRGVWRLYRLRPSEFVQSIACLAGVALIGVVNGIGIALALAILGFLWRGWRPYSAVLGRVDRIKGYHDLARHPEARRIPGLVLLRWDAPLFFANAEIFRERMLQAVREAPTQTAWIVIAAEPVTDVDLTAADTLARLRDELLALNVTLCFAEMKGPVKDSLKHYGLFDAIGEQHFFPTVGQAVNGYLETHDVEWRDWEDEA